MSSCTCKTEKVEVRPYALRKAKLDPRPIVEGMTRVQQLVYLAAHADETEAKEWADEVFRARRDAYEATIEAELARYGCGGPVRVSEGPELKAMRDAADEIGAGIANTYNYYLAHEIVRIREEVPTANRHVYTYRLFYADDAWAKQYWAKRTPMIAGTEVSEGVNMALEAFYRYNSDVDLSKAEVWPYPTACPVCAEFVKGNPYDSMAELYRRCELPAHPRCPHTGRPTDEPAKLGPIECAALWRG